MIFILHGPSRAFPLRKFAFALGVTGLILAGGLFHDSLVRAQGGSREKKTPPQEPVTRVPIQTTIHPRRRTKRTTGQSRQNVSKVISLLIISTPPGCKVAINGEPRGETDAKGELEIGLAPANYTIRLTREGYAPSEGQVELTWTDGTEQEVAFDLVQALATLNIVTDPSGAEVYLDEVYKGTSNSTGLLVLESLSIGRPHKLRITKPGYTEQADIPITTYSGQISVRLLPDSVRLKVSTDPPDTEIYFDDIYKGVSTSDGLLIIEHVNPNQSHRVRGKKVGYIDQIRSLLPNASEISLKLQPDPIVLIAKDIKRQTADGNLAKAFEGYNQLTAQAPDHPELARLLDGILQSLQGRSADTLKQIEPFGLVKAITEIEEMKRLYDHARKWRSGDEAIEVFGKYWDMKFALAKGDQPSSDSEKERLRRDAQTMLTDLGQRNLRNLYLLMEFGWAWLKLSDSVTAQKYFTAAQELKPDWAYSYFASAVLALQAGDREVEKRSKAIQYQLAIDNFTRAIGLKHDFTRAYALRCIAYAVIKKHAEAASSGLQAITIDPNSAYAHFALGFAYFQKGGKTAYRNSKDEFDRALSLGGSELDQGTKGSIQERLAIIHRSIK